MLHCNKNRYKSVDVNNSVSKRLFNFRYSNTDKLVDYLFGITTWVDLRLNEMMDKVYGNHR